MPSVARAKVEELGPGTLLGRYRLVRELGRGAMGLVFLADDMVLKQQLCVKVLDPRLVDNPEAMERFHREIVLARRIAHRSVCRLHDLHQEGGLHFITMEYVDGTSLRDLLGPDQPLLSVARVMTIVRNICSALGAAHDVNVIHRDLKPANVMVCAGDEINLLDFGIATADDLRSSLTLPGIAIGTRHYIAPEVWTGRPATAKSDQFSVGVILYNCLTRQRPFSADREMLLIEAMKAGPPPPPSQFRPEIHRALDEVALRALSFAPVDRFEDMRAFAAAIGEVEGRAAAPPLRKREPPTSHVDAVTAPRGVSGAAGAAGDLTIPPALRAMSIDPSAATETEPVELPRNSARTTLLAAVAAVAVAAVIAVAWPGGDDGKQGGQPVIDGSASAARGERVRAAVDVQLADIDAANDATDGPALPDPQAAPTSEPALTQLIAPPDRPVVRAQPSDKQKRWGDARAGAQKAMQDRGILPGDDDELDRLRARAASDGKARRFDEAIELEGQARRRVDAIVVDKAFVKRKLVRFNGRFDASRDAAARARVEGVSTDVLNAMRDGRAQEANRALNAAFAALGRRAP